jgi:hypothetical protein
MALSSPSQKESRFGSEVKGKEPQRLAAHLQLP